MRITPLSTAILTKTGLRVAPRRSRARRGTVRYDEAFLWIQEHKYRQFHSKMSKGLAMNRLSHESQGFKRSMGDRLVIMDT